MSKSKIEWTESSWNPVTGCTKISDGCKNCYAEKLAMRLKCMGQESYVNGFDLSEHERMLSVPLTWKKSRTIFVCSMSDLFHKDISESFLIRIFDVMREAYWHNFQVLTKRAERMAEFASKIRWPKNVWAGVTVESYKYVSRIQELKKVPAQIRFLSLEPLLSNMPKLDLDNIHWVIVGGESGSSARPIDATWVQRLRDQCVSQNIPFFFKQWGGVNKKKSGRTLDNTIWDQWPELVDANPLFIEG